MSSKRLRRRIDAPPPLVDQHFGRQRTAVVVRAHHRSVGAGVENRERARRPRAAAAARSRTKTSLLSQTGPTMSHGRPAPSRGVDRIDAVERRRRAPAASARSCRHRARRTARASHGRSRGFMSTTRASSAPALPTSQRPGSTTSGRPVASTAAEHRFGVVRGVGHGAARRSEMPRPPPRSTCSRGMPSTSAARRRAGPRASAARAAARAW